MATFIVRCENLIVESGELLIEADTAEEALELAKDPEERRDMNYSFSDTAGSRIEVVGQQDADGIGYEYWDADEDEDDSEDTEKRGPPRTSCVEVDNFGYITPYVLCVVTGSGS